MPKPRRTFRLSIRVEPEVIVSLDKAVEEMRRAGGKMSRSHLLREMAIHASSFYDFIVAERAKQGTDTSIALDGNLSQWLLNNLPPGVDSRILRFLVTAMHLAAEAKEKEERRHGE